MNQKIKISQLPAKGANLSADDLLEVAEFTGTGYISKSITGQEIIDAAAGGGSVTDVTATAPIESTGGTTPDLSIRQSGSLDDGYLSSADWIAFNNKQEALVSGTNIKTVNGNSLLGSGGLSVQPTLVSGTNIKTVNGNSLLGSGDVTISGGGASGLHAPFVVSGGSYSYNINANLLNSGISIPNNTMRLVPFIPSQTFTCSALYINCTLLSAGNLARILIYSNVNNLPTTKLYESADLDLSTTGIKTATTSFTFTAGTTYWICTHTSGSVASLTILPVTAVYPIRVTGISNPSTYVFTNINYTLGTAPTTIGAISYIGGSVFYVGITAA